MKKLEDLSSQISFENTKRLVNAGIEIDSIIKDMALKGFDGSSQDATKAVNKALYEYAEKLGLSLWDLCYRCKPKMKSELKLSTDEPYSVTVESTIELVPFELEFEKGPGYWKGKYYSLKEKMRELIDDKDI